MFVNLARDGMALLIQMVADVDPQPPPRRVLSVAPIANS